MKKLAYDSMSSCFVDDYLRRLQNVLVERQLDVLDVVHARVFQQSHQKIWSRYLMMICFIMDSDAERYASVLDLKSFLNNLVSTYDVLQTEKEPIYPPFQVQIAEFFTKLISSYENLQFQIPSDIAATFLKLIDPKDENVRNFLHVFAPIQEECLKENASESSDLVSDLVENGSEDNLTQKEISKRHREIQRATNLTKKTLSAHLTFALGGIQGIELSLYREYLLLIRLICWKDPSVIHLNVDIVTD